MRSLYKLLIPVSAFLAVILVVSTVRAGGEYTLYSPVVVISPSLTPVPTMPPTPTKTPTPTMPPTPTKTSTPTIGPSPTSPPSTTGDIEITFIFFDGAGSAEPDEYVQIQNMDTKSIQVQSWTLRDEANHVFTFPNFVMVPGKVCRVYTNLNLPMWCSFNYGSGSAIWNNSGDCATLMNANEAIVSVYCYP